VLAEQAGHVLAWRRQVASSVDGISTSTIGSRDQPKQRASM
jgi:hypothetical protein